MSAIGGVLMFGGRPVDSPRLGVLGARLLRLGPDGGRDVVADPVGMTYRAFHTNAESRREHQPHCWGHQTILCWDGRLDNRDELLSLLRDDLRGEDTDAAIVMAAYRRWDEHSFVRLLGDFALSIWDRRQRAVWLVRDAIGARTLYYHMGTERLLWSTDLSALIDVAGAPLEINDEYIACQLTFRIEPGLTPYIGIHEVKPAHALRIDHDGLISQHRFWSLDPREQVRYATDGEYEEHFRAVFRDAVRARLRSDQTIFSELSGGLDSSSIVCMADDIMKRGDAAAPGLETVSYVLDDASTSNEEQWIAHVDAQRGATGHRIYSTEHPYLRVLTDTAGIALPNFALCSSGYAQAVRARMRDRGARVLFHGTGGDEVLYSRLDPSPELADLFASKRVGTLHDRLKVWSHQMNRPYTHVLWKHAVIPNLPEAVQVWLRTGAIKFLPDWLDERFVRRMQFRKRLVARPLGMRFPTPSMAILARSLHYAFRAVGCGIDQELGSCENVYPFLDRRLVEYLFAIPFQQKLRPGENRSLMRRALKGLVPDAILSRQDKSNPRELIYRAVARDAGTLRYLLSDARVSARGYIDPVKLAEAFRRATAGSERLLAALLNILTIELWLRVVEAGIPPTKSVATAGERAAAVGIPHEATL